MKWGAAALGVLWLAACAGSPPPQGAISTQQWSAARSRLQQLRVAWVPSSSTISIRGRFHDARAQADIEGRGAIAFRRPDALRMMLVTAAGLTGFDLWIRGDEFRMAMPLQGRVWRGDHPTPELPVEFLRWWLLHPLEGRMSSATDSLFVLRYGDASYEVSHLGEGGLQVIRRTRGVTERIEATRPGCGTARYINERLRLEVTIECEAGASVAGEPDPRAFEDPDKDRAGR